MKKKIKLLSLLLCLVLALTSMTSCLLLGGEGLSVEDVEDEKFVWVDHPMTREHFISFLAFVNSDTLQLVKLYPEGGAQCRFKTRGGGFLYLYCSRHGLMKLKI